MEKKISSKWKKKKLSIRSALKLILTSFREGKLKYIANFKIKNATPREENDSLNNFFKWRHYLNDVRLFDCLFLWQLLGKTLTKQKKPRYKFILIALLEKVSSNNYFCPNMSRISLEMCPMCPPAWLRELGTRYYYWTIPE